MSKALEGKKTLLLVMNDSLQKKVTIPAEWKVTFGLLVPGQKEGMGRLGLRFWSGSKGSEMQHAVFTDVVSFRDMSIEVLEQVEETRQENFHRDGDEGKETVIANVSVKEWINPDAPKARTARPSVQATPGALIRSVRSTG